MITKRASSLLASSAKWNFGTPLGAGALAFGVGSGMSVGESAGLGLAGVAGFEGTKRAIQNRLPQAQRQPSSTWNRVKGSLGGQPNQPRFGLSTLGRAGALGGALAASFGTAEIGRRIGEKFPIWQRGQDQENNQFQKTSSVGVDFAGKTGRFLKDKVLIPATGINVYRRGKELRDIGRQYKQSPSADLLKRKRQAQKQLGKETGKTVGVYSIDPLVVYGGKRGLDEYNKIKNKT